MFAIYGEICKKNLKIFLLPAVLSVLLIPAILLIITDLHNSSVGVAENLCQKFFALSGILLMSPIFAPEQKDNVKETLMAKVVPLRTVYFIRLAIALLALAIYLAGFIWLLILLGGSDIEFKRFFIHTLATALLLGGLGMAGTRFGGNIGVGYMIAFGFYMIQQFFPIELIRHFYIFTLKGDYNLITVYLGAALLIIAPLVKSAK